MLAKKDEIFLTLQLYMCLKEKMNLTGIFVLVMAVKEITAKATYILLNLALIKVNLQMYLNI